MVARAAFSSALYPVFRKRLSSRAVLTLYIGWASGGVRDDIAYDTRLEVSPTGICSFLESERINCQSSDFDELVVKGLWWAATCFELLLSLEEVHLLLRPFEIGSG